MTAQTMIDNVAAQLNNLKIGDTSVPANVASLLHYLNLAKNQMAVDTLIWLGGETISMTTANEYTMTIAPIQIIDMYDESLNIRPRNSPHRLGYYQLSPSVIYMNNPENGVDININYYYAPDDYVVTDELDIPPSLIRGMELYMSYLAYDFYKTEKEQALSMKKLEDYDIAKNGFISKTDNMNVDSITSVDLIYQKGLV